MITLQLQLTSPKTPKQSSILINASSTTLIEGFTIANGNADGSNAVEVESQGGGIFIAASIGVTSEPTIDNCIIRDNTAKIKGGGAYVQGSFDRISKPVFTNCEFNQNHSDGDGGALYNDGFSSSIDGHGAFPTIQYTEFEENTSVGFWRCPI